MDRGAVCKITVVIGTGENRIIAIEGADRVLLDQNTNLTGYDYTSGSLALPEADRDHTRPVYGYIAQGNGPALTGMTVEKAAKIYTHANFFKYDALATRIVKYLQRKLDTSGCPQPKNLRILLDQVPILRDAIAQAIRKESNDRFEFWIHELSEYWDLAWTLSKAREKAICLASTVCYNFDSTGHIARQCKASDK